MSTMKKILILFLTLILACSNDNLTEIRNDGTGGVSCSINGEVLKQKTISLHGPSIQFFKVYEDQGVGYISILLSIENSNNTRKNVRILIPNIEFRDPNTNQINSLVGVYSLLGNDGTNGYGTYEISDDLYNSENYSSTENYIGELNINYHDIKNYIVSGTFWFDAVNENGEIVEIRDGRFDKKIND